MKFVNPFLLSLFLTLVHSPLCFSDSGISVGHIIGLDEEAFVDVFFKRIAGELGGMPITIRSDLTVSFSDRGKRFENRSQMADLVVLYAGQTAQIGEITSLAREGRILPLEDLPDFDQALRPEDLYQNLLAPATFNGKLYAVPLRVSPPIFAIPRDMAKAGPIGWDLISECSASSGMGYSLDNTPYLLWRGLFDGDGPLFNGKRYLFDEERGLKCFEKVWKVFDKPRTSIADATSVLMLYPDDLIKFGSLLQEFNFSNFPIISSNMRLYVSENSWYLGVSSAILRTKTPLATKVLATLLDRPAQRLLEELTHSPSPRPSHHPSQLTQVTSLQPADPLRLSTGRLTFLPPLVELREAEAILENAFSESLARPEKFLMNFDAAVKAANSTLEEALGGDRGDLP